MNALIALAADVRAILGPSTKITYGADWSEYFGHHPQDGSGDVYFHLDPLWASPNIGAIGIDAYWPLADWRDGRDHTDWQAGHRVLHDLRYLKSNLRGGEGYDWYYAGSVIGDRRADLSIAIGEESERYEIDVLDGDTPLRTLTTASPTLLYSTADQLADFGTTPDTLTVRICQLSERFGRGAPATAVL